MKTYIAIAVAFVVLQLNVRGPQDPASQDPLFVPPTKNVTLFTFGFSDLLSSLMWVRVVQDIDVCEQKTERTPYPEYTEGDAIDQVVQRDLPAARCDQGWVFQMLDVVSDLTPGFKAVYRDGATFLSVLVDDRKGAQKIFAKGREYFPESWQIFYHSAYHELFEMQNMETAAELMRQAGEKGAPRWVFSLAAKLYTRTGRAVFAKTVLERVLAEKGNGVHGPRLRNQLEKINKILSQESR